MNRLPSIVRQHIAGLRLLLVFTVLTGIIYPVVMTGIAQVAFKNQANGSMVTFHGRVVGSSLLCQEFVDAKGNPLAQYFQPRPSAATPSWSTSHGDAGSDSGWEDIAVPIPEFPSLMLQALLTIVLIQVVRTRVSNRRSRTHDDDYDDDRTEVTQDVE